MLSNNNKIGFASDHAGFPLKEHIRQSLEAKGYDCVDYGAFSTDSVSYADFGHKLARGVETGEVGRGIAVCGTGNGINMTLNHHAGIRSALCWSEEITRLVRAHNDANVLALPGRFISEDAADRLVDIFLNTGFDGGRHSARIEGIPL
jgi:ribose 5-phosphate isomerase B